MKLLTYRTPDGTVAHGALVDHDTVAELGEGDLLDVIAAAAVGSAPAAAQSIPENAPRRPLKEVTVLAPLLAPGAVYAAASNYQAHISEGGGELVDKTRLSPKIFLKPATSVVGPGVPFALPDISQAADWEAELAIVIGRTARNVGVDEALDYVYGYTAANDISLRSLTLGYERDTENPWVGFFDWLEGKWADGSAPMGPWLVTADEVPDPQALAISLTRNGELRQEASTGDMIFSCAELIAFCSRLATLSPGDVILTGTPAGVGATTEDYLVAGDVMVVSIEGLGELTTPVH